SQIQALGVYFAKVNTEDGQTFTPNRNLAFTRANHYVFSYGHAFSSDLRVKTEIYYQHLTNVPVSVYDSLSFSTLNIRGDYVTDRLINKGSGRNYGVDISIEKHLHNNL